MYFPGTVTPIAIVGFLLVGFVLVAIPGHAAAANVGYGFAAAVAGFARY